MIERTVDASDSSLELVFPFENISDYPLVVENFEESCGCMKGKWNGVAVEPGQRGEIKALFSAKGLRGKVNKSLRVHFVGGGKAELVGRMTIRETLSFSERTLRWPVGKKTEAQTVEVAINSKTPVRILEVRSGSEVEAQLSEVEAGKKYQIKIRPHSTESVRQHVVQVRTDSKDSRDAIQAIFVLIENSSGERGPP